MRKYSKAAQMEADVAGMWAVGLWRGAPRP